MALFSECTDSYAQKLLDTADIVREAIFRQVRLFVISGYAQKVQDYHQCKNDKNRIRRNREAFRAWCLAGSKPHLKQKCCYS
jgi:hypothetical protein